MDVVLGGLVHVHVDHHRPRRRVGHLQARLLDALPDHRLGRGLTGIEMPTGLHPAKEAAVPVEYHPSVTDDDGRGGDMGRIRGPIEGPVEPAQLDQHDVPGQALARIGGPMLDQLTPKA